MRVFVTGATGWVGSAVVRELLVAGHSVSGLTTSESGAAKLKGLGVKPYIGKLSQHDLLRRASAEADGVIHTAFVHGPQYMNLPTQARLFAGALVHGVYASFTQIAGETEMAAMAALGAGLERSGRPLIVASGIANLPLTRGIATEEDDHVDTRRPTEAAAFKLLACGVRVSAVRLPPTVHGEGDAGFVPRVIQAARKKGVSPYVGDGSNRWPAVHRLDAAKLFHLALEQSEAGAKYHAVAEEGIPFRDIASLIAKKLHVPTRSIKPGKSNAHFGIIGRIVSMDTPASSALTRQKLGWSPVQQGLLADIDQHYVK